MTTKAEHIVENPRLNDMLRYKDLTRKFLNLALRVASHPRCTLLVNNTLDSLSKQVDEELNASTGTMDPVTVPTNVTSPSEVITARLKKKEVQTKTSKRKKSWLDKMHKGTKKGSKK